MSWLTVGDYAAPPGPAPAAPVTPQVPMVVVPMGPPPPPPVDPAAVGRAMTKALQDYMVMTGRAPAPVVVAPPLPKPKKTPWGELIVVGVVSSLIAGYAASRIRKAYRRKRG